MKKGHFYFLKDKYFIDFQDLNLMSNKEKLSTKIHDRPCFYAFQDTKTELYWLIPISSQIEKYKKIYNSKIEKNNRCDTIVFGDVLGFEKAFLIQNMCPVNEEYVNNEYVDSLNSSVKVSGELELELYKKAKKVLALVRQGRKLIFPDVLKIEKELLEKGDTNLEKNEIK